MVCVGEYIPSRSMYVNTSHTNTHTHTCTHTHTHTHTASEMEGVASPSLALGADANNKVLIHASYTPLARLLVSPSLALGADANHKALYGGTSI